MLQRLCHIADPHWVSESECVYPVQDKPQFWKRKPSIMKCHMLILAHLARADIPKSLRSDYAAIMKKCPLLLEEIINIANVPRPPAVRPNTCAIPSCHKTCHTLPHDQCADALRLA